MHFWGKLSPYHPLTGLLLFTIILSKDCGHGMYLSGLCKGEAYLDDGKSHNHCTRCPDFGVCIGDYREAHCSSCGDHYFAGLMGNFFCTNCGGGGSHRTKIKPLKDLPPPTPSAWNGTIEEGTDGPEARALFAKAVIETGCL